MAQVIPFRGVRPPPARAAQIAAPPYDVVSSEEARALAAGNPHSFFHVSRPEIDLPRSTDEHADEVYEMGRRNLEAFLAEGWLERDQEPSLYAYRLVMEGRAQLGLVGLASVAEYDDGRIRKHELTRADKEDDRARHVEALEANDEPVFLIYRTRSDIDALMREATTSPPLYDFTVGAVVHTFWRIPPRLTQPLLDAFAAVERLYVADGHHRSAAASRVQKRLSGRSSAAGFLSVMFPHDQVRILPYNRLVRDLAGRSPSELLARLAERFEVRGASGPEATRRHELAMYLRGAWYSLTLRPAHAPAGTVAGLDVSVLQDAILAPLLGVGDPRTDPRIQFVGGIRGTGELTRLVDGGAHAVAFALHPTSLEDLMAVADAGEIMPPKSTWFEPKLLSGLVVHRFE